MSIKRERAQEQMQFILSELLRREVRDPKLHNVTVTDVEIDAEFAHAKVYVNALGDESRKKNVLDALKRAKGFLRGNLGRRMRLRKTPQLHFYWDTTLEYAERMNQLLSGLDIPEDEEQVGDDRSSTME